MPYARGTTVSAQESRADIERVLTRFGADSFGYMSNSLQAAIVFRLKGRNVRIGLPFPSIQDKAIVHDKRGATRTPEQRARAVDAEVQRRWRCLLLVIKAKLTAIEDGISTVDREFLPDMVLADGRSVLEIGRAHV